MRLDSEQRQDRALDMLEALESLFEQLPDHHLVEPRHVTVLLAVAGDAVRAAMPRALRRGANDHDDDEEG